MTDIPLTLGQRCINACGPGSKMRAILEAVFHKSPRTVPAFADTAVITSDGYVMADFKDREGDRHSGAFVCGISELVDNARRLADHMKLSDEDRTALFAETQKWIVDDWRAIGKAPLN